MPALKKLLLHPFCLAAYPVVYLLAANVDQLNPRVVVRPLLAALLAALVLLLLLRVLLKDWLRAALVTTFLLLVFFSYGHVLGWLKAHPAAGLAIGRHRYLAPLYLVLSATGLFGLLRLKRERLPDLTQLLNAAGLVLLLLALGQTAYFYARTTAARVQMANPAAQTAPANRPDVYLIILDGYARADVLQSEFGFDNTSFTGQLQRLGFYVASSSASNYNTTEFSLASLLNLDYLSAFGTQFANDGPDRYQLQNLIKDSAVRRYLEGQGYQVVAFDSGYAFTNWWSNSTFLSPSNGAPVTGGSLRPFEAMLLKTTLFSLVLDAQRQQIAGSLAAVNYPYAEHVDQVLYALDKLPYVPALPGAKLVFAHIVVPHKPLVFKADGSLQTDTGFYGNEGDPVDSSYFHQGYIDQVRFVNPRILSVLRSILTSSKIPPVIVLMGDHGYYWGTTHFGNLLAVYLPGGAAAFYPAVTNVNVFRLILNQAFGASYPLLPDQSFVEDPSVSGGFRLAGADDTVMP